MTPELPTNVTLDAYVTAKEAHPNDHFARLFALYRHIGGFESQAPVECPYVERNHTADGRLMMSGRVICEEENLFIIISHEKENRTTHEIAYRRDKEGNVTPYSYAGTKTGKTKVWFEGDNSRMKKSAIKASMQILHGAWNSIDQACKDYV